MLHIRFFNKASMHPWIALPHIELVAIPGSGWGAGRAPPPGHPTLLIAEKDCLIMLVGNKMDLHEQRTVFVRDGRSFARKNGLAFIETSALDATGVDTAFQRILQEIYKTQTKKQLKAQGGGGGGDNKASSSGGGGPARGQTISLSSPQDAAAQQQRKGCCGGGGGGQ